ILRTPPSEGLSGCKEIGAGVVSSHGTTPQESRKAKGRTEWTRTSGHRAFCRAGPPKIKSGGCRMRLADGGKLSRLEKEISPTAHDCHRVKKSWRNLKQNYPIGEWNI